MDFAREKTLLFSDGKEILLSPSLQKEINSPFISEYDNEYEKIPIQYEYVPGLFNVFGIGLDEPPTTLPSILNFYHYINSDKGLALNLLLITRIYLSPSSVNGKNWKEISEEKDYTLTSVDLKLLIRDSISHLDFHLGNTDVIFHFLILNVLTEKMFSTLTKNDRLYYKNNLGGLLHANFLFSEWYSYLYFHLKELRDVILLLSNEMKFLRKTLFLFSDITGVREILDNLYPQFEGEGCSPKDLIIKTDEIEENSSQFISRLYWNKICHLGITFVVSCEVCSFGVNEEREDDDDDQFLHFNNENMEKVLNPRNKEAALKFVRGEEKVFSISNQLIFEKHFVPECYHLYDDTYDLKFERRILVIKTPWLYMDIRGSPMDRFIFENQFFEFFEDENHLIKIYDSYNSPYVVVWNTVSKEIIEFSYEV